MEGLGQNDRADNIFHCPRCGTVKVDAFGQHGDKVYVPRLIHRCRGFEKDPLMPLLAVSGEIGKLWNRLGIAESINLPKDRPS